jgi:ArsR family transcriptional regulator, arsenate/arsenite/antimonite-responsive transcriptional repressor
METLAQIYKALSEEIRLRIVMLLMQGELCVCDLMDIFGEPQSKISRHLAYLKHSGLIRGWRVGVWMHYDLKESLDEPWRNQLNFMKDKLSDLPEFRQDRGILTELKKQKNCKAAMEAKRGNQSKQDRSNRLKGK